MGSAQPSAQPCWPGLPGVPMLLLLLTCAVADQAALALLGLDGDSWVKIQPADKSQQQQQPCSSRAVCEATVRAVLQGVLDLSGSSPRRYLFQVLSHFTDNTLHKERLQYFATAEGRDDLYR
eukprot:GHUV01057419.1.p2 GENE.GHUV01057419.1~~GHUV01057419.1.p2  ORF type:complete len:122 (+),score=47.54 GHUV01057419.1:342-707(+)